MKLFLNNSHTEFGVSPYSESTFSFLNRCGRKEFFPVRALLEEWFMRYPEKEKDEFRKRFQSGDDKQFNSAFFELYLHELLSRIGYQIQVHPKINTENNKSPDFLAIAPNGDKIIFEAVLSSEIRGEGSISEMRAKGDTAIPIRNQVFDSINSLKNPFFYLHLSEKGKPSSLPSLNILNKKLIKWLNNLPYSELTESQKKSEFIDYPKMIFEHSGWEIEFTAYPKSKKSQDSDIIRSHQTEVEKIDYHTPIKKAIKRKASKYGNLKIPYIIAINVFGHFPDHIDIMNALFGQEAFLLDLDFSKGVDSKLVRRPNGIWTSALNPIHTRISAVIFGFSILPWTVASKDLYLYHNPWASLPYKGLAANFNQFSLIDNEIKKIDGTHPRIVLGLPQTWPYLDQH